MRDLEEIAALYRDLDAILDAGREAAVADPSVRALEERRQRTLAQAFLLIAWGQIEAEIDEKCRAHIRKRRDSDDWSVRRGFDIYNPDDRRLSGLSFEERAAIVLDKTSPMYRSVMSHYNLRNRIAHGLLDDTQVEIQSLVADLHAIHTALAD